MGVNCERKRIFCRAAVLLPGLTVLFLCALLSLYRHDGDAVTPGEAGSEAARDAVLPVWEPVNINTATAAELESLPGIGPALARKILEYREVYGPFSCVEDLVNVSGIGWETLGGLEDYITTDGGGNQ